MLRSERRHIDPVQRSWLRFCAKLARVGLARASSEAPRAFARRVVLERADLAAEVMAITRLYTRLRYGRGAGDRHALERQVSAFRPRRRRGTRTMPLP